MPIDWESKRRFPCLPEQRMPKYQHNVNRAVQHDPLEHWCLLQTLGPDEYDNLHSTRLYCRHCIQLATRCPRCLICSVKIVHVHAVSVTKWSWESFCPLLHIIYVRSSCVRACNAGIEGIVVQCLTQHTELKMSSYSYACMPGAHSLQWRRILRHFLWFGFVCRQASRDQESWAWDQRQVDTKITLTCYSVPELHWCNWVGLSLLSYTSDILISMLPRASWHTLLWGMSKVVILMTVVARVTAVRMTPGSSAFCLSDSRQDISLTLGSKHAQCGN